MALPRSLLLPWIVALIGGVAAAQDVPPSSEERIEALERRLAEMDAKLEAKEAAEGETPPASEDAEPTDDPAWESILGRMLPTGIANPHSWLQKFSLAGYGESHANLTQGSGSDKVDVHRLVLAVGYQFNSWISLDAEVEIEHGFVADGADGELVLEQAFLELRPYRAFAIRAGRILTPLGIYNVNHEPPGFPGVERPSFAKVIIPTTWSSDGIGIFGNPLPWLSYEAYAVSSIDGSQITASGIRGARIKARPSLNEMAFTGRIDVFPFATHDPGLEQSLRIGVSTFVGGIDNGDNGKDPGTGTGNRIEIYSADLRYSLWRFTFRGALAYERIDGAQDIGGGAPSEIFGFFTEFSVRVLPDAWKQGLFSKSEVVVFCRYDDTNTQYRTPPGVARDPAGNRHEYTFGVSAIILPNLAFKIDYQIREDKTTNNLPDLLNLGIGFQF